MCRTVGSFRKNDGDGSENVKKVIVWLAKQQLCTCITLFCTFLCRHCTTTAWNCLISRFMEDVNKRKRVFFFSFKTWVWSLRNQLQGNSPTFYIFRELEQAWESLKKRQFILKVTFSLPSPSSMLKLPIIESPSGSWKLFGEINVILERKQVCKLTARALKGLKVCL